MNTTVDVPNLIDDLLTGFTRQADRLAEQRHKQEGVRLLREAVPHLGELHGTSPGTRRRSDEGMLSVREVAAMFGVGASTVTSWIKNGRLDAIATSRLPGSRRPRYMIREAAVEEFKRRQDGRSVQPGSRRKRAADGIIKFF